MSPQMTMSCTHQRKRRCAYFMGNPRMLRTGDGWLEHHGKKISQHNVYETLEIVCEGSNEVGPRCWARGNTYQKEMIAFLSCISPDLSPRDPHLGLISHPAAQPLAQWGLTLLSFPSVVSHSPESFLPASLGVATGETSSGPSQNRVDSLSFPHRPHRPDVGNVNICILIGVRLGGTF